MIIDTHCHIFPAVRERLQNQLPAAVFKSFDEWIQKSSVPPGFASLKTYWIKWVEGLDKKGMDIEGVQILQGRLHPNMYRVVEGLMTSVLAPKLIVQGTVQNLTDSMKANGIEKVVVMSNGNNAPSEWVLDQAAERPELIPVVDLPLLPANSNEESYFNEMERLVARGAKGFYIHPNVDNLPGDHPAYRAYFEVAKKHQKFIVMHTGLFHIPTYKNTQTPSLAEFEGHFQKYPDVNVCLAHMNRDRPEDAWQYMKKYPQLYADTSWQSAANIRQAVSAIGHDRILLGSDWPFLHMNLQKDALEVLNAALDEKKAMAVCSKNAKRFLNI